MAIISIPKKEIEKIAKITEETLEKINLMGTPVENVKDNEIEIEVLPNRPDMLSVQGFLRTFRSYMNRETGLKEYKIEKPEKDFRVKIDKNLAEIRPYTACAIVKNLKFNDERIREIIDIQEKIHAGLGRNRKKIAIGIYPLEKIKLPIKFEARAPKDIKFTPLESNREMNGLQILQQHSTGREYAHLLEGKSMFPVFVDAAGEILSMPPIINSHRTGKISEQTKDIFIECSGFDFNILKKTLNIIITTLGDMGGKIYAMELDYGKKEITPNLNPEKMSLSIDNVNKLIGLKLKEAEIKKLLERMGYNYKNGSVLCPAWRTDILHEVDIIEDIAIAYGYNNLEPEIPKVATIGEEAPLEKVKSKIAEILTGLNMIELSTYHMIKEEDSKIAKLDEKIELQDSKTEYKILRPNLLIPALRTLSENKDNEYPQRVFEIGTTFELDKEGKSETGITEKEKLCIAITNNNTNFTDIKQILDYISRMMKKEYKMESSSSENPFFIEGRCGKIMINNKTVGNIGEIKPQILSHLGLKMPIAALEIDIGGLIN